MNQTFLPSLRKVEERFRLQPNTEPLRGFIRLPLVFLSVNQVFVAVALGEPLRMDNLPGLHLRPLEGEETYHSQIFQPSTANMKVKQSADRKSSAVEDLGPWISCA
jgi:hypothetical protein